MSVIIRLQNLPWSANALDIREFFKGLSIPEGGVHIVGGELGDAFIAFSTDEDARLAMQKSGSSLKGIQVTLLLSSRSEMQKVIEAARQQAMALQGFVPPPVIPTQPTSASQPPPTQPPPLQSQPPPLQSQPPPLQSQPPPLQSQPPPQIAQPIRSGLPHQQMAAHTPYQVRGHHGGMDGPDQMPPHLPLHMVPPPNQQMAQPGSSMSMPPTPPGSNIPNLPPPTSKPGESQSASSSVPTAEKKDDKKSSSSSSSSSRRDSKSRRRRTKSRSRTRSRSRDRDRRRRHRSRSRSRSRDRSSRSRRRSRSRDRDRGRDRNRDRDRDKDRSSRSGRDRNERVSLDKSDCPISIVDMTKETNCPVIMPGISSDGIPGLGEIPSLKGPLPSSLAEPLKNSPIQTPSHSPAPPFNTTAVMPPNFQGGKMFTSVLPPGFGGMSSSNSPLTTKFNEPMETEAIDDSPIVLEGPPDTMSDPRGMRSNMSRGPNEPPRVDVKGGLLGDGPQSQPFGGPQGRPMGFRGGDSFGYGNGPMGRPHPGDMDYMDSRGGRGDSSNRQRDPRDRGFRGDMDMSRGKDDDRNLRDESSSWETSGSKRERSSRWEAADKRDTLNDPPDWHSRGRRDGWGDREDDKWGGRGDPWKDDFGRRDDRDSYDDPYGYPNYRGRGARGMDRGRIARGGRGFNPRFGAYPGFPEENGDSGYGFRGGYRGRGGFRGRGGPFGSRDGTGDWAEDTCSVELRNVPTGASYRAIREFFHGIFVPKTGIKLLSNDHGIRIDMALLQFSSPRDAQRALRCSGNYIFDNKVEVVLTSESQYEAAVDANQIKMYPGSGSSQAPPDNQAWPESTCLCVSGIPIGCTENEIIQFFNQYNVQDIVIENDKRRCFVKLSTTEAANHAVSTLNNSGDNGNLMVEICPPDAMAAVSRDRNPSQSNIQSGKEKKKIEEKKPEKIPEEPLKHQPMGADLLTDTVVMKGVPKDATEANLRDFFSDEGLVPERFHFCDPHNGDGTRQVYIIFPLIEDARKAVGKSQQQLSKVKVDIELIAKPLVMVTMGLPFDPLELIRKGQKTGDTPFNGKPDSLTVVDNKEDTTAKKDTPQNNHSSQEDNKDVLSQEEASSLGLGQDQSQSFTGAGLMGQLPYRGAMMPPFPGGPRAFRPFMARMPMGMSGMRGPVDGSFSRMRGSVPLLRDPVDTPSSGAEVMGTAITPEEFGKPGCVVSLANVPYRATTEDILNFFRDFPELRPENIIRRYNEFNQPTADARVCFRNPQDAQQAVQTLNRSFLIGRQVFLTLLTDQ